jgi:hypothetical protein
MSTGLKILSFIFPIVGGYLYFKHRTDNPSKAKLAGKLALFGFGAGVLLNIIMTSMTAASL